MQDRQGRYLHRRWPFLLPLSSCCLLSEEELDQSNAGNGTPFRKHEAQCFVQVWGETLFLPLRYGFQGRFTEDEPPSCPGEAVLKRCMACEELRINFWGAFPV